MLITTNVSSFANAQINAYRGLAKKATETGETGSQDSSVVAALKRFFYKLDFLLKYGHFPSGEDTAQDALPKELRELKTFLENPHYEEKSYILQKDANTRYCFTRSDTDTSQITVTEERRYVSPAGAEWRLNEALECEPNELLVGLGDKDRALYMEFWDKFGDFFRGIGDHKEADILQHVWDLLNTNQTTPKNSVQTEGDKLKRSIHIFNKLKEFADPAYKDIFVIHMSNAPFDPSLMKVAFVIDGTALEIQYIDLKDIDVKNVDMINVSMQGADLRKVNLKGAINLRSEALTGARLPSNFKFDTADINLMKIKEARFANEVEVNNEQIKNEPLNEKTEAGTRTAEAIPSEHLVQAGDLSEDPAYQKINIKGDGYCFFRCVLIQSTGNEDWANCTTEQIYSQIQRNYYDTILKAIENTNLSFSGVISFSNSTLLNRLKNPTQLIEHTITNEGGYLWSPRAICAAYSPQIDFDNLLLDDRNNLYTFCDTIYMNLTEMLNLNSKKDKGSYAIANGGHYTWYKKLDV